MPIAISTFLENNTKCVANSSTAIIEKTKNIKDNNFNDVKAPFESLKNTVKAQVNGFYAEDDSQFETGDTIKTPSKEEVTEKNSLSNISNISDKKDDNVQNGSDTTENSNAKSEIAVNKSSWASLFSHQKTEIKENSKSIPYAENVQATRNNNKKDNFTNSFKCTTFPSNIISPENDEFLHKVAGIVYCTIITQWLRPQIFVYLSPPFFKR